MFDYLWSKTIATILWPLHVLPTKFVYKEIGSAIGIQKTIGLEVQNGYGLIETSPCVTGRQPYYNVYNSLFRSVFEIYRYGSVCFFLVALSETDFRFRHHCFVPCFKSIDLDLFVLFVCFLCTFASGIQKRISSSPKAIKLIVFSFIRISLAYTELIMRVSCFLIQRFTVTFR
ncbi:hypothetical protein V6Z11_D02G000200 [Gossypium hirsutum]|uniref:Uncharacterized protein n=1 Tax=Gossypium tomentosum TaxID=34277 RepID=A0A5D2LQT4_GOSTO|nr:hypothetical protein ES332_D02G000100v1 [Gossypium tomentosum]